MIINMKGYKVFNKDWKCRNFQYEIGKTYEIEEDPKICKRGFHFCTKLIDCFNYYSFNPENKVAEIEALGDIDKTINNTKCCTNKIKIVREISWYEVLNLVNITGEGNTGYYNSGDCNSGHYNSGSRNSGHRNSGYRNSGNHNSGDHNSGDYNLRNYNSGDYNSGNHNSGDHNSGSRNTGDFNSGCYNSGHYNSGNYNSGNHNSGNSNLGDYNSGHYNFGCFNSKNNFDKEIMMFNKPSNWTLLDWENSKAHSILIMMPINNSDMIYEDHMTEMEKQNHPEYKTIGGYIKEIKVSSKDRQEWWDNLSDEDKEIVMSLPNFDPDIFYECTEIKVNKEDK